jgi:hypothetical protein
MRIHHREVREIRERNRQEDQEEQEDARRGEPSGRRPDA